MLAVFLADGFEEVEAIAPVDMLRRAGCDVKTVGVGGKRGITGSHGIPVTADITDAELDPEQLEGVILPGGLPGADHLRASEIVKACVLKCQAEGKLVAAICAAPYVLGDWGVLEGKEAICYPGYENHLTGAVLSKDPVCVCGNTVTGKGAGVAVDFGLTLVSVLRGQETAEKIRKGIQCR